MKQKGENKAIMPEKDERIANKKRFFYPDHQITIEAESREEADKELQKVINKK